MNVWELPGQSPGMMRQGLEQAVHPGKLFSQKQKNDVQDFSQVIPNILLESFFREALVVPRLIWT